MQLTFWLTTNTNNAKLHSEKMNIFCDCKSVENKERRKNMSLIKTPVKGMPEKLPNDMALREYVIRKIKDTYKKFGFMLIETPIVEHIENLTSKQGGENEKLIFKILKRGEKLENSTGDDLCDCGLRYDLTLPLSRFYANNKDNLPVPFKSLQIGESFRADRPQKGRFRQFTQCDIDVLGDETYLAEIELISATANMLKELNITGIKVRVNDRAILRALAQNCNFPEEQWDTIFIILDKLDKIGIDGVKSQLLELGLDVDATAKYCKMFENISQNVDCKTYLEQNNIQIDGSVVENLSNIISSAQKLVGKDCKIVFDPTLVRGMSYYTGPIFEIELESYNLSVAGGGRYDEMVGKFCSQKVCACGFSIGLERILSVISENNLIKLDNGNATAFLISKDVCIEKVQQIFEKANEMRKQGQTVLVSPRKNNAKFQKEMLQKAGYSTIIDVYND